MPPKHTKSKANAKVLVVPKTKKAKTKKEDTEITPIVAPTVAPIVVAPTEDVIPKTKKEKVKKDKKDDIKSSGPNVGPMMTITGRTIEIVFDNSQNIYCLSFLNAIRRIIIGEIPTITINPDSCEFITRLHTIYNHDIIKEKLQLIPINQAIFEDDITQYSFALTINNKNDIVRPIYSTDIKIMNGDKKLSDIFLSKTPFILGYLNKTHNIDVKGGFIKNTPLQSSYAHQSCSSISLVIVSDDDMLNDALKKLPKDINEYDKNDFIFLNRERLYKKHADDYAHAYRLTYTSEYMFDDPIKIFKIAKDVLIQKLTLFKTTLTPERIIVETSTDSKFLEYHSETENHTLFNMLQQYLLRDPQIEYAGYYETHPMKKKFILRIIPKTDPLNITNAVAILQTTVDKLLTLADQL
jgi:DNA-directed RNA polymerase subunit L